MRTTIDVDKEVLDAVAKATGEKSLNKAVRAALLEYLRRRNVEKLIALAGKIEVVDDWREMEELELEDMERTERKWSS